MNVKKTVFTLLMLVSFTFGVNAMSFVRIDEVKQKMEDADSVFSHCSASDLFDYVSNTVYTYSQVSDDKRVKLVCYDAGQKIDFRYLLIKDPLGLVDGSSLIYYDQSEKELFGSRTVSGQKSYLYLDSDVFILCFTFTRQDSSTFDMYLRFTVNTVHGSSESGTVNVLIVEGDEEYSGTVVLPYDEPTTGSTFTINFSDGRVLDLKYDPSTGTFTTL